MKSKIISLSSIVLLISCVFIFQNNNYANNNTVSLNDSIVSVNDSIQIGDSVKVKIRKSSSYISNYFGNRLGENGKIYCQSSPGIKIEMGDLMQIQFPDYLVSPAIANISGLYSIIWILK
jgi:hypothetical protein